MLWNETLGVGGSFPLFKLICAERKLFFIARLCRGGHAQILSRGFSEALCRGFSERFLEGALQWVVKAKRASQKGVPRRGGGLSDTP